MLPDPALSGRAVRRARAGPLPRVALFFPVLLLASVAVLWATFLADQAIRTLTRQSLEETAGNLALTAQRLLREGPRGVEEIRRLFADRVVAYAYVAEPGGLILFHTNAALQGATLEEEGLGPRSGERGGGDGWLALGTGRPAFLARREVRLPDGRPAVLGIVLHAGGASRMLARARGLRWSVGVALALLWGVGLLLAVLSARAARLRREVERAETLALIGQMTATLAHEIRNAVGGVKGHAQWLAEKTPGEDPRAAGLAMVVQGAERIEALVADLLRFSREERYELVPVDAAALLRESAREAAGWGGRVEVLAPEDLRFFADREKLAAALANGVRNALEAMGPQGELRLLARATGGGVELRVEDTGPGLAPAALSRLFTPFYTTKADGTGLGLAYAKKVVEGMGGQIRLEDRAGAGATLILRLPRARGG